MTKTPGINDGFIDFFILTRNSKVVGGDANNSLEFTTEIVSQLLVAAGYKVVIITTGT